MQIPGRGEKKMLMLMSLNGTGYRFSCRLQDGMRTSIFNDKPE